MRQRIALLLALGLLLMAGCSQRFPDDEQVSTTERIILKFSHVAAENSPKGIAAQRFAQAVKERTGGRVEIQVFASSRLYKEGEELRALQDGGAHIIAPSPANLTQISPSWQVFDLPYLFGSFSDVERLFTSNLGLDMRENLESHGYIPLAIWGEGFKQFTSRLGPIITAPDFGGHRFPIQASPVQKDQFTVLGSTPVISGFDTLYTALERRDLDGTESTLSNVYTRNLDEVQSYLTISNHGYLSSVVLVKRSWWDGLSPELREKLREALADASQWLRENTEVLNEEASHRLQSNGRIEILQPTPVERRNLEVALHPVYLHTTERLGRRIVDRVLAVVWGQGP